MEGVPEEGGSEEGVPEEGLPAGMKKWRHPVSGNLHRLGGPAQVNPDYEAWYVDGVRHRVDGPAIITPEWRQWWHHGRVHRLDGPATVWADGLDGPQRSRGRRHVARRCRGPG